VASSGATGSVTISGPLAGDTVTVNGLAYTAVTGPKANNTEFSIDGTNNEDAADLADSVNNDTREGTLGVVKAYARTNSVTFFQVGVFGTAGNATTIVSSNGTRLPVLGATFSDGQDLDVFSIRSASVPSFVINKTYNPAALSSGRTITVDVDANAFGFNLRSFNALLSFIQKAENRYESLGGNAAADTATNFLAADFTLAGATPGESFVWNIEKDGNFYIVVPTANS
jgi:hypothetical protein